MTSPYRDTTASADAADEPMPQFREPGGPRRGFVVRGVLLLLGMLLAGITGDLDEALKVLLLYGLPLGLSVLIFYVVEQPVRRWFDRRRARLVARGIEQLEARVATMATAPNTR